MNAAPGLRSFEQHTARDLLTCFACRLNDYERSRGRQETRSTRFVFEIGPPLVERREDANCSIGSDIWLSSIVG